MSNFWTVPFFTRKSYFNKLITTCINYFFKIITSITTFKFAKLNWKLYSKSKNYDYTTIRSTYHFFPVNIRSNFRILHEPSYICKYKKVPTMAMKILLHYQVQACPRIQVSVIVSTSSRRIKIHNEYVLSTIYVWTCKFLTVWLEWNNPVSDSAL